MEKQIKCTRCGKIFVLTGNRGNSKEVVQGVTCPVCGHPNEVHWPMDMGWSVFVPAPLDKNSK